MLLHLALAVSISSRLTRIRWLTAAADPPRRVEPIAHAAAKGRMRPLRRVLDQTVLHRVETNIVEMSGEILLVADRMLSVSPLPDATLVPADHDR
jgi:hypothetical protein